MSLPAANYPAPPARAQLYQQLLERLRAMPGVQGATAMSGLPPDRQVNANDTEIDNYTAPPEGPFENVDYYQNVMADYFETMGIPIVDGRGVHLGRCGVDRHGGGGQRDAGEDILEGSQPDRTAAASLLRRPDPWFTVVGVAKDVKQGGLDQKTGTELYFFVDQMSKAPPPVATLRPQ